MRIMRALGLLTALFPTGVLAQSCRQSWMPPDTPVFCAWENEPSLPEQRTYLAVTASDKDIYVLGGYRYDAQSQVLTYFDTVQRARLGADGHLSAWTAESSFTGARSGAGAARAGTCVFIAGGTSSTASSTTFYDDVQSAAIQSDGQLSKWTTSPNHLKIGRSNPSLVAITTDQGTFLNVVAGVTQIGLDTVHLDTIELAKIGADCTVGPWSIATYHIKGGRSSPQALAVRNSVIVIGGWGDIADVDVFSDVQSAAPRIDGSPAPWKTSANRLPTGIYGHATALAHSDQMARTVILSIGGQPGTGAYANWIGYTYVFDGLPVPDGIGVWRIASTGRLSSGRAGLGAVVAGHRLYVIGGNDAIGHFYSSAASAVFDIGQPAP